MDKSKIAEMYYFEGFSPERDKLKYEDDPDGNLAAALNEASDAFIAGKKQPEWDSFKDYMEFCFKRKFVRGADVESWLTNLKTQPPWRDMQTDGRSQVISELFQKVFKKK